VDEMVERLPSTLHNLDFIAELSCFQEFNFIASKVAFGNNKSLFQMKHPLL
jgi:hypothetical protein